MQVKPLKFSYKKWQFPNNFVYHQTSLRVPPVESAVLTVVICTMIFANETCFHEVKAVLNSVTELNQQKTLA
jgi:hypothetical protein